MRPIIFNDELLREINAGIDTTFSNMFGIKTAPGAHTVMDTNFIKGDVSGIINLVQDSKNEQVEGSLILSFPSETIFQMLSKIYNRPFTSVDKNVKSGVGELTNIVFGIFKANLNRNGFSFQMALPNVIYGEGHEVYVGRPGRTLIVPYDCAVGTFSVTLTVCADAGLSKAG